MRLIIFINIEKAGGEEDKVIGSLSVSTVFLKTVKVQLEREREHKDQRWR